MAKVKKVTMTYTNIDARAITYVRILYAFCAVCCILWAMLYTFRTVWRRKVSNDSNDGEDPHS